LRLRAEPHTQLRSEPEVQVVHQTIPGLTATVPCSAPSQARVAAVADRPLLAFRNLPLVRVVLAEVAAVVLLEEAAPQGTLLPHHQVKATTAALLQALLRRLGQQAVVEVAQAQLEQMALSERQAATAAQDQATASAEPQPIMQAVAVADTDGLRLARRIRAAAGELAVEVEAQAMRLHP
jgi:CheY-like chemotaxis protein